MNWKALEFKLNKWLRLEIDFSEFKRLGIKNQRGHKRIDQRLINELLEISKKDNILIHALIRLAYETGPRI